MIISAQFMFVIIVPFARPDYWRDRIGGRPLLIWVNLMGFPLIGCYIYWSVCRPRQLVSYSHCHFSVPLLVSTSTHSR